MKKVIMPFSLRLSIAVTILCVVTNISQAQNIGVNATGAAPAASAGFDVDFTNKGLLIPRVALTATNAAGPIVAPATSLLVYNTATAGAAPNNVLPGYYYWDGAAWVALGGSGGKDWSLLGNAGTDPATNFVGTTDAQHLQFRTNNTNRMRIMNSTYPTVGIGTAFPVTNLSGNTAVLHVHDGGAAVGSQLLLSTHSTTTGDRTGLINFSGTQITNDRRTASIESYLIDYTAPNASGDLRFFTNNANTYSEKMRIFSDARVAVNATATFAASTLFSAATGNNNAVDGSAAGNGTAVYGQNTGAGGYGVRGLTNNGTGMAVRGSNISATATAGFGGFFSTTTTAGVGLVGNLNNATYFPGSAISAVSNVNSTVAIIAENSGTTGVVIQAQTTAASTTGVLSITDNLTAGNSSIIGQVAAPAANGSAYSVAGTTSAVRGSISGTRTYSFGVLGLTTSTANRTGGVIGLSPTLGTWSSMGYRSNAGTILSFYYTTAGGLGNGTGKLVQGGGGISDDAVNIGMGGCGDLMGQWVRGNVYGMNVKGNRYGLYVDGKTYTNNVIAQLSEPKNGDKREVAYVSTAVNVDVLDRGMSQLSNGKVFIPFSSTFKNLASKEIPVMVTVTPNGASNGVYVESVTNEGFIVVENNGGASNTKLTWIAIATRVGYENPETPQELLSKEYDTNMDGVMFNENNLDDSATNMRWDGSNLYFSKNQQANSGQPAEMNIIKMQGAKELENDKQEIIKVEE
jgi:hypothetical protein